MSKYQRNAERQSVTNPKEKLRPDSILSFCEGMIAERAKERSRTREYQKYDPDRYRVKSKVR